MLLDNERRLTCRSIIFNGEKLSLQADGTLYWPEKKLLVFSDLHLEKGSHFASYGQPLPLYDTRDTLARMKKSLEICSPDSVLCLGDSLHDSKAFERMQKDDKACLENLIQHTKTWYWIAGNHDAKGLVCQAAHEKILSQLQFSAYVFSHEKTFSSQPHIIGHYHPKLNLSIKGQFITGKCFVLTDNVLIMPAFGSYTGGLDVTSHAIESALSSSSATYYFLKKEKIWPIKL